jgi:hypothetical protein
MTELVRMSYCLNFSSGEMITSHVYLSGVHKCIVRVGGTQSQGRGFCMEQSDQNTSKAD